MSNSGKFQMKHLRCVKKNKVSFSLWRLESFVEDHLGEVDPEVDPVLGFFQGRRVLSLDSWESGFAHSGGRLGFLSNCLSCPGMCFWAISHRQD